MDTTLRDVIWSLIKGIPWWGWVFFILVTILGPEEGYRRSRRRYHQDTGLLDSFADWIWYRLFEKPKIEKSGISQIDSMSGREFERYLATLFQNKGYKVDLVGSTYADRRGDYGADLIIEKDGLKTAVQAKNYRQWVGIDAVREVMGGKDYYHCQHGLVVTNNYFSDAAKEQACKSNIYLWDRNNLIEEINKLKK